MGHAQVERPAQDVFRHSRQVRPGDIVQQHGLPERCDVLFSPSHGQVRPRELADWIVADRLPVRFQLQLHKLLWGEEQGR